MSKKLRQLEKEKDRLKQLIKGESLYKSKKQLKKELAQIQLKIENS